MPVVLRALASFEFRDSPALPGFGPLLTRLPLKCLLAPVTVARYATSKMNRVSEELLHKLCNRHVKHQRRKLEAQVDEVAQALQNSSFYAYSFSLARLVQESGSVCYLRQSAVVPNTNGRR